jgi:hypothetical protein
LTAPTVAGGQNLSLAFNSAGITFQADNESALTPPLTEAVIAAALGANLNAILATIGLGNPLILNAVPIATVPMQPFAPAGTSPGLGFVDVATLPLPGPATPGQASVAFCLTLQDRPNTPVAPVRGRGNPALLMPMPLAPGADALLVIETGFLFELLASLSLEAPAPGGLGIAAGALRVGRAGITLPAATPVTLGGTAGTLIALLVTPPPAGTTTLTMTLTFSFVVDAITYVVTIVGATFTLALSGATLVVATTVPTPTVTAIVPWWVMLIRILAGAVLGLLTGGIVGAVVGGVAGGLSISLETAIVSALTGAITPGALAGVGAPAIPAALTALLGPVGLTPPLVFDDLQLSGRTTNPKLAAVYRREPSSSILSTGGDVDLDSATIQKWQTLFRPKLAGVGKLVTLKKAAFGDLGWSAASGLSTHAGVGLSRVSGTFNSISFDDASTALRGSVITAVSVLDVPVIPASTTDASMLPSPLVLAVKTDEGRIGKLALWQDASGDLIFRYLLWDPSGAVCRIFPAATPWARTQTVRDPDTPATPGTLPVMHERYEHQCQLLVQSVNLASPLQNTWRLGGTVLAGTGRATIASADVSWHTYPNSIVITCNLGSSLDQVSLEVEVRDANGLLVRDSRQLSVVGRYDGEYVPALNTGYAASVAEFAQSYQQYIGGKLREQVNLPQLSSPLPLDAALGQAMQAGDMPEFQPPLPIR